MQRRKVLFPEPDGPIMHITSRGLTSRSMPRSTSSLPKFFCTASALTIGALLISTVFAAGYGRPGWHQLWWGRRWGVEGEQHPPESLQRCERLLPGGAAAEASLDVVLADRQDRRHHHVPDARDDQQFENVVGRGRDLLLSSEQLGHASPEGQRRGLQHRNGFVSGWRNDDPHRLRQHDASQ